MISNTFTSRICMLLIVVIIFICSGCADLFIPDRSNDPLFIFESFWSEIDQHYSYFEGSKTNWDSVSAALSQSVTSSTTDVELFYIMDSAMSLLNDGHLNLHAPHGNGGNTRYFSSFKSNPIIAQPDGPYFENFQTINRQISIANIVNSTAGYLRIRRFDGKPTEYSNIDSALQLLDGITSVIVDVRSNFGGDIRNAELGASHFCESQTLAYEYRVRNGKHHNDFTPWYRVGLTGANQSRWRDKKVIVLTNRESYSATEWFVLFMKKQPNVIIVGDTTGGGGSVPITRELPNGWILRIPNTQTRLPSGEMFQRRGIAPDVAIWITEEDAENGIDTILEAAVNEL